MTIERWDPFGEMLSLRDAMDRLFQESVVRPGLTRAGGMGQLGVPVDLQETENEYIVEASLPGMRPEDIDVSVQGNQIRIQGEMKQQDERQEARYHLRERRYGRFQRTFTLPSNVQADQVSCDFDNGLLKVTLPKAEEARPRRIAVSGQNRQLEQTSQSREVGQRQQGEQQTKK